jgi:DNA polymerase-3 subunit epsilon
MGFSADFTAIDFETANRRKDSACQLAAVTVRNGDIVDERMWMIRPDPFFFSPSNIRIHGIRPADVEDQPTFAALWDDIASFLADDCLIAHNAAFDLGVLLGCLSRHGIPTPEMHFSCTRLIAKETWPDRPRFGLKPLSNWLGVEFRHHDALEDSRACAKLLLAAGIARQAESLEDLEHRLRLVRGKAGPWGISNASRKRRGKRSKSSSKSTPRSLPRRTLSRGGRPLRLPPNPFDEAAVVREMQSQSPAAQAAAYEVDDSSATTDRTIDWQRIAVRAEFIQPLRGKRIVFFGDLRTMSPQQAVELAGRCGGELQTTATAETHYIVVGSANVDRGELESARRSKTVQVLDEDAFLRMIGASSQQPSE